MTELEFFDNDAAEVDGIRMEIWEPDLIVLPIPENRLDANTPVQINVFITNNTPTTFAFVYGILTPELVEPGGQALHSQKLIDEQIPTSQYDGIGIPPKRSLVRCLIAKLSWQNNLLQLQASISDSRRIPTGSDNFWSFGSLQLGTYQLRFTYLSPKGEFLFADAHTGDISRVESAETEPLATPFVNLRLVEPVGSDKSAVEVGGIRFETVIPERRLSTPLIQPNVKIPVQIGIQITNNTSTPFRFSSFDTLIPELIGADGLIPRQNFGGSTGWKTPRESDFQLAMPGESVTLFPKAHLVWQADGLLNLIVPGGGRACWKFNDLKLGTYQMQLTYRSPTEKPDLLFEDLWMGMVHTPFVEFHLVQP